MRFLNAIMSATFAVSAILLGLGEPPNAAAQQRLTSAQQKEVQQLQSELARIRTQISTIDSIHREAMTSVAVAIDQIDRGFFIANSGSNAVKLLAFLTPVNRVVSLAFKLSGKIAQAYDAVQVSLATGRLTTTRRELVSLMLQIDNSRLDAIAPWLPRLREVIARLQQLGVQNP